MLYLVIVLFACAVALPTEKPYYKPEEAGQLFEQFIIKYNRNYSPEEKNEKFEIFKKNLKEYNELNKEQKYAVFGINNFSDISKEEFLKQYTGLSINRNVTDDNCQDAPVNGGTPPAELDLRQKNIISPVKNQVKCGSCWAFSTTGLLESQLMKNGKQASLSEQQLVDCDMSSNGCHGGMPSSALTYITNAGGITSEQTYPYTAHDGQCHFNPSSATAKVSACYMVSVNSEEQWKQALVQYGALSILVSAQKFHGYNGGIMNCGQTGGIDHAVLLVGYGQENGVNFWIVKNSWSTNWGEQGYIRIAMADTCCSMYDNPPVTADVA